MAKLVGPFFQMKMSGTLGDVVFDRRGIVKLKGDHHDARSADQGDIRQTMAAAQKCVKVCGSTTRQLLKRVAEDPTHWSTYLVKKLIGSNRESYLESMSRFVEPGLDQPGWESAAVEAGLHPVGVEYAEEGEISPGAQLFILASTLFSLGLYEPLGQPNGNAAIWKNSIIS